MSLANIIFMLFAAIAITGGFMAVWLKNVFYNALSLILCLIGVAGLFIYLNSEFLAVMEVIIYIGGISIAIIFAIMLSQPMTQKFTRRNVPKMARSGILAALFGSGVWLTLKRTNWPFVSAEGDYSIRTIGKSLLTANLLPFEAVSIILLLAIIGALVISNKEEA